MTAAALALAALLEVYPSGRSVPQALLRISLRFASPQDESVAAQVRVEQEGSAPARPFADPPLWSADRTTLTLLLDPSRQKLALANNRSLGFLLRPRRRARLLLGARVVKRWNVTAGTCPPLEPARWAARPVRVGSRDRLVVRFGAPVDGLARDYLAVAAPDGSRVAGSARLGGAEHSWSFVPTAAWRHGDRLAVHPRLENPCGDEPGEPFEHRPAAGLGSERRPTFIPLRITN